ncbi:MAG: DUF4124 domain-containing protein [Gammaproteobacteria bacterium]|nr:DUF4124 domain-containing protein [Gammaproteobacteria bacterium]
MSRQLLLAGLLCLPAAPLVAEVYQWRDEQGRVHFSDRKPPDRKTKVEAREVEVSNIDESSAEREKLGKLFQPATAAEQKLQRQQAQQRQRDQLERAQQCTEARQQLLILQGPVYFTREDGSTYTISEAEREQKAAAAAAWIASHCDL